jgi:D-sedoheptulose 7-phosphate isomerase
MKSYIEKSFKDSISLKKEVLDTMSDKIVKMAEMMIETYKKGGKVVLFGNGGSAADAQHIAAELIGYGFPAIALTTDTSVLTSIANDDGYFFVFATQIRALVNSNDVAIAISTSGNSNNVIRGLNTAFIIKAKTIALLGKDGGEAKNCANLVLIVPSQDTARIQEVHITIGHIVCELVRKILA